MRHISLVLALAACACAAPAGNTSNGSPDAGAPDAGVVTLSDEPTLPELLAYWDSKLCHVYACAKHERENAATCARASASEEFPFNAFREARAAVRTGRGTYDAEAGKRCAQLLKAIDTTADCYGQDAPSPIQAQRAFQAACGDLLDGLVANGGACDHDTECQPGGKCRFDVDRDGVCTGSCVIWLHPGDDCSARPMDCAPDSYCDGTTCHARTLKANGEFCVDSGECKSGKCFDYACKDVSDFQGECVTNDDCASAYYCRVLPPSTGKQGICQVPALTGVACGYAVKCAGNQPCAGYANHYMGGSKDGACQARPHDVGDSCLPLPDGYDYGDTGCFADLSCNPATAKCEEPPAIGSPCAAPNRCGIDAWCDAGTCRAKKPDGAAANGWAECLHEYDSSTHTCFRAALRERCYGR